MPKVTWGEIIVDTDDPSWVMFVYKIQVRLDALMMMMMSKMRMMMMMMMMMMMVMSKMRMMMMMMMMVVIMSKMRRKSWVALNDDHCFSPRLLAGWL